MWLKLSEIHTGVTTEYVKIWKKKQYMLQISVTEKKGGNQYMNSTTIRLL
jgi:hypothetical protein